MSDVTGNTTSNIESLETLSTVDSEETVLTSSKEGGTMSIVTDSTTFSSDSLETLSAVDSKDIVLTSSTKGGSMPDETDNKPSHIKRLKRLATVDSKEAVLSPLTKDGSMPDATDSKTSHIERLKRVATVDHSVNMLLSSTKGGTVSDITLNKTSHIEKLKKLSTVDNSVNMLLSSTKDMIKHCGRHALKFLSQASNLEQSSDKDTLETDVKEKESDLLKDKNDIMMKLRRQSSLKFWNELSDLGKSSDKETLDVKAKGSDVLKDKNASKGSHRLLKLCKLTKLMPSINTYKLQIAREKTEHAIKMNQIFSIQGGYTSLRNSLRQRGWVENYFHVTKISKQPAIPVKSGSVDDNNDASGDDVDSVTEDVAKEDDGFYQLMARMVKNVQPTLIWVLHRDFVDHRQLRKNQIVNHFLHSGVFTTKVGLCLNLRNLPWYNETDPNTFFPRCYLLCHSDEKQEFIDDFNLTTCISILKIVTETYNSTHTKSNKEKEDEISTPATVGTHIMKATENLNNFGEEPDSFDLNNTEKENKKKSKREMLTLLADIVEKAVKQCNLFISSKDNQDLDFKYEKSLNEAELADLRDWHYRVSHSDLNIEGVTSGLANLCENTLKRLRLKCPQMYMDGKRNIWIIKPGAQSRGRGIICYDNLESILKIDEGNSVKKETKYVVQKYIERPLLIYNCKFDIRQWFLVTDWNPLTVWFYKDCYLRFCSQEFTLNDFNESIHLCNNVIQRNYKNGPRSKELPQNNMWTHHQFKDYLRMQTTGDLWEESIYPQIKKAIICSVIVSQELVESRKGSFELYGADFMLSDDYIPWLIEINSNPSMQHSTDVTSLLCCKVLEDTLKVIIDRKVDKCCDIGNFELGYKQNTIRCPLYLCLNMSIEGQRIKTPVSKPIKSNTSSINIRYKQEKDFTLKATDRASSPMKFKRNAKSSILNSPYMNNGNSAIPINRSKLCKPKSCLGKLQTIRLMDKYDTQFILIENFAKEQEKERQAKFQNGKSMHVTPEVKKIQVIKSLKFENRWDSDHRNYKLSLNESKSYKEVTKNHVRKTLVPNVAHIIFPMIKV